MYALGVDLGGTNLRIALLSSDGKIIDRKEMSTPHGEGAPEKLVSFVVQSAKAFQKTHTDLSIAALGIGSPGPLSRREGVIRETPNLPGYDRFPLVKSIQSELSFPCFIDNDANCAAFAEWKLGAARGKEHFFMLTLGTGIGGAIVSGGRMIYGKNDGAAELGHITLYPGGLPCPCGKFGCYEQYASATAIKRRFVEAYQESFHTKEFFQKALEGEEKAQSVLKDVAEDLALGIGSLLNTLDPEMLVLGGGIFKTGGEPLVTYLHEAVKGKAFQSTLKDFEIKTAHFQSDAGVVGAALMGLSCLENA